MPLHVDSTSAIQIALNHVFHDESYRSRLSFILQKYQDGLISLPHVSSEDQLVDLLTKSLTVSRHSFLVCKLFLVDHLDQLEGVINIIVCLDVVFLCLLMFPYYILFIIFLFPLF